MEENPEGGHGFSVELASKRSIKSISLSEDGREGVLMEGTIGQIEELEVLDGAVLQIKGSQGTIMVDLCEVKLRKLLDKKGSKRVTTTKAKKVEPKNDT